MNLYKILKFSYFSTYSQCKMKNCNFLIFFHLIVPTILI